MTDKKTLPRARFDFNEAVQSTLRDHPALADKVVFVDVGDNLNTQGTPTAIRRSGHLGPSRRMAEHLEIVRRIGSSLSFSPDTYGIGALLFHSGNNHAIFSKNDPDVARFASFDHELGHLLTRSGFHYDPAQPLAENAADAYAVLRHIQRFGNDTPIPAHASTRRAQEFIFSGAGFYLTSMTIDKIADDARGENFDKLTPQQTVERAEAYAREMAPTGKTIDDLLDYFAPVRALARRAGPNAPQVRKILQELVDAPGADPLAVRLGRQALSQNSPEPAKKGPTPPSPRL